MNHLSSTKLNAQDQLDLALAVVRQSPALDGSLWLGLIHTLNISETALAKLLEQDHAIAVIEDDRLLRARIDRNRQAQDNGSIQTLVLDERCFLLCEDPWSTEATLALASSLQQHAQLALARPGQTAALQKVEASAVSAIPTAASSNRSGKCPPWFSL